MLLSTDDPLAIAAVEAIHSGDVVRLRGLLADHTGLATARLGGVDLQCGMHMTRTLLHVATDWPGNFDNAGASIRALVSAGADVNARFEGPHRETPLHWAASSDDVEALDALLDCGAEIEADGAVIAGGTPLADAVAFGQWKCARRLIERGARANLWQAAALGFIERVQGEVAKGDVSKEEITQAFWLACHGGQREAAAYLLQHGADLHWVGYDQLTALDAARRSEAHSVASWLEDLGAKPSWNLQCG